MRVRSFRVSAGCRAVSWLAPLCPVTTSTPWNNRVRPVSCRANECVEASSVVCNILMHRRVQFVLLLHRALVAAQCIVIGPVCVCVGVYVRGSVIPR